MELSGNEMQIQALFSELKLVDGEATPEFMRLWKSAEATPARSPRVSFRLSWVTGVAMVLLTASLLLWAGSRQQVQLENTALAITSPRVEAIRLTPSAISETERVKSRNTNVGRSRKAVRRTTLAASDRQVVSFASWQSPTAILLASPAQDLLTSLPQLDRSVSELKTFLPTTLQ